MWSQTIRKTESGYYPPCAFFINPSLCSDASAGDWAGKWLIHDNCPRKKCNHGRTARPITKVGSFSSPLSLIILIVCIFLGNRAWNVWCGMLSFKLWAYPLISDEPKKMKANTYWNTQPHVCQSARDSISISQCWWFDLAVKFPRACFNMRSHFASDSQWKGIPDKTWHHCKLT